MQKNTRYIHCQSCLSPMVHRPAETRPKTCSTFCADAHKAEQRAQRAARKRKPPQRAKSSPNPAPKIKRGDRRPPITPPRINTGTCAFAGCDNSLAGMHILAKYCSALCKGRHQRATKAGPARARENARARDARERALQDRIDRECATMASERQRLHDRAESLASAIVDDLR